MSPSSVQKQHGEHPARKMWLRRAVLAEVGDGAAYVPFIGSGDIPLACYRRTGAGHERRIGCA